jgi:hypothetical protein
MAAQLENTFSGESCESPCPFSGVRVSEPGRKADPFSGISATLQSSCGGDSGRLDRSSRMDRMPPLGRRADVEVQAVDRLVNIPMESQSANLPGWEKEARWIGRLDLRSSQAGLGYCWRRPLDAARLGRKFPPTPGSLVRRRGWINRGSVSVPLLPPRRRIRFPAGFRVQDKFRARSAPVRRASAPTSRKRERTSRGASSAPTRSAINSTNPQARWASRVSRHCRNKVHGWSWAIS